MRLILETLRYILLWDSWKRSIKHICFCVVFFWHWLTHWVRVTHICANELSQNWFRWRLVNSFSVLSYYLNRWWLIVTEIPRKNSLQWRHNENDGVSNHWHGGCLINRLFRRRSKKTSKFRVIGLCEGNSPVTREFPTQRASDALVNSRTKGQWRGECFHWMT